MIFPEIAMGQRRYLSEAGLDVISLNSIEILIKNKEKIIGGGPGQNRLDFYSNFNWKSREIALGRLGQNLIDF